MKHPENQCIPLLSEEELQKTLIVDDQISAIRDTDWDHLIVSKKFVKFCDKTKKLGGYINE